MKFILSFLAIASLTFAGGLFLPNLPWLAGLVAFGVGSLAGRGFMAGFLAVGLVWAGMAWQLSSANEHLLLGKIATLFKAPNPFLIVAITGLIGGLMGGLCGWAGASLKLLEKKENN